MVATGDGESGLGNLRAPAAFLGCGRRFSEKGLTYGRIPPLFSAVSVWPCYSLSPCRIIAATFYIFVFLYNDVV